MSWLLIVWGGSAACAFATMMFAGVVRRD